MGFLKGQGATEYLVLLAIVLIVALVSVALLGFFPGMAQDSKIAQTQAYWRSASPLAVLETGKATYVEYSWGGCGVTAAGDVGCTNVDIIIQNNGAYPIRLKKLLSGNNSVSSYLICSGYPNTTTDWVYHPISDIYIAPGTQGCFGARETQSVCPQHAIKISRNGTDSNHLKGATSTCGTNGLGYLVVPGFGFEYDVTIDGQTVTKREVGKDLIVPCGGTS